MRRHRAHIKILRHDRRTFQPTDLPADFDSERDVLKLQAEGLAKTKKKENGTGYPASGKRVQSCSAVVIFSLRQGRQEMRTRPELMSVRNATNQAKATPLDWHVDSARCSVLGSEFSFVSPCSSFRARSVQLVAVGLAFIYDFRSGSRCDPSMRLFYAAVQFIVPSRQKLCPAVELF